jgi:hypothetical protein
MANEILKPRDRNTGFNGCNQRLLMLTKNTTRDIR